MSKNEMRHFPGKASTSVCATTVLPLCFLIAKCSVRLRHFSVTQTSHLTEMDAGNECLKLFHLQLVRVLTTKFRNLRLKMTRQDNNYNDEWF